MDGLTFYGGVIRLLQSEDIPFLVGGAYAVKYHAGIHRDTKDLDLFVRPADVGRVIETARGAGFDAGMVFSHWLAKIRLEEDCVDVIFRGANGLCEVGDSWFGNATAANVFKHDVLVCPAEETVWMKAYVMERQRYDGADILHLIRSRGRELDWQRLVDLFGPDWLLLLGHLILFHYVYPSDDAIPGEVMNSLVEKLRQAPSPASAGPPVCNGPLLSAAQYLPDIERFGYVDARLSDPRVVINESQIATWKENVLKAEGN